MILETKQYLIYFEPPLEISKKVQELNKLISAQFENIYSSIVKGVWRSHMMVYVSPMPSENEEEILKVVKKISKDLQPFEVKLGGFSKGPSGYIFIDLDEQTQKRLFDVRVRLVDELLSFRNTAIKQKYLDAWDEFTKEEKERIKSTGIPYEYKAHITIAQIPKKDMESAIELVKDKSLAGNSFVVEDMRVLSLYKDENNVFEKFRLG